MVLGLAALLAANPGLLAALTVAGAGYLLLLGVQTLVRPGTANTEEARGPGSPGGVLLRGAGVSGPNLKALMLYLAVLPQFLSRQAHWRAACP
ncbi:LysE family transporter [Sciscionella marina]|uniref:LysE family transporter n=1 Tax=Sciscionella marina TaxID=508770 RepID=UPI001F09A2B1|nr:LysE family transporter [Sciscionella marina]